MSSLGTNIKTMRKFYGYTQEILSKTLKTRYNLKVTRPTISRWEADEQIPTIYYLKCLSEVFGVTLDELCTENINTLSKKKNAKNTFKDGENTSLPILGSVAAGTGAYTDNDIIGYEEIPSSWINPNEQYVILIVEGDSMYPKFEDGDKVLVKVQSSVDSGDYGIVLIDGDSAVIKKITYNDNTIELISANPMYPPRRFENEDVLNVRVFGLVKKSWRCY